MGNKPFHAPLQKPKRILDIGAGTGILTVKLGREFPDAEVIGVDISPVPNRHKKPDNVTFVQGNVLDLVKNGDPVRWRVENSWSKTAGTEGYFVASDRWMDEFCYQAVVDPSVVDSSVTDVLKQKATVLPLWDPMGALA